MATSDPDQPTGVPQGSGTRANDRLDAERVRLLYLNAPLNMTATLVNSGILVYLLWNVSPPGYLLGWLSCNLLLTLFRYLDILLYRRATVPVPKAPGWGRRLCVGLVGSGILWGAGAFAFFPAGSVFHQALLILVLGGMVAGAVGAYSVMMTAFLGYTLPIALPLTLRLFLERTEIHLATGAMVLLFTLVMIGTARRVRSVTVSSIQGDFTSRQLIQALRVEKERVDALNAELEQRVEERTGELTETNKALQAEIEDRKKVEAALRDSRRRYRELVEDIDDMIYTVDSDGIVTYVSPAVERLGGYNVSDVLGRPFTEFFLPEDRDRIAAGYNALERTQPKPVEHRLKAKSGETRWGRILSRPVFENDRFAGVRGVLSDITEQKRNEEEREKTESQLRQLQKMEAIGTLAGGIAHDFNNILASVIGYCELALQDTEEQSLLRDNLEEILAAALRAKHLVSQVLSFSRQTAQERRRVRIQPVVENALRFIRSLLPASVEIRERLEAEACPILAEPGEIQQVLVNLCTNASRAIGSESGRIDVTLKEALVPDGAVPRGALAPGPYVKLAVRDTGHGMDEAVLHRVFDPFFTTRGPGEGTGMGLSVVHGIASSLGGRVLASSRPGEGSTFEVWLPTHPDETDGPPGRPPEEFATGKSRILFVDDEPAQVKMQTQVLRRLGYQVLGLTSSEEALEAFRRDPEAYDLVITDMTMPTMTGADLARNLLALRPDVPILLCTGFSEAITEEKAADMGIRRLLLKPILTVQLREAIEESIGSSGTRSKDGPSREDGIEDPAFP